MDNKIYRGLRNARGFVDHCSVTEDGFYRKLNPRFDLANHSPDGFEWGYSGSGPAQLALAILADATGDDDTSVQLYQLYKRDVISGLDPRSDFRISGASVRTWLASQQALVV